MNDKGYTAMKKGKKGFYNRVIKRALDILFSVLILTLFCWLYLILAVLVRIKLGSPVIFKQDRPGMIDPKTGKEKIFRLYKFRSMSNARDKDGKLLPDKDRLTKFGRILRATSLDELPEVWNILKGDMSLIGPRPLGIKYLDYYTEEERHRHDVRPGLSGWAQVNGRNNLTWEEKFSYDLEYVENVSFGMDVKTLFLTVKKVIMREGIGQGEQRPISLHVERADRKAEKSNKDGQ